ncbi:MAG TPA: hypothetical protein PKD56_03545 [Chitinophagales bacterium]|nr:hypothetical protein [Chitinophagales bacterium]
MTDSYAYFKKLKSIRIKKKTKLSNAAYSMVFVDNSNAYFRKTSGTNNTDAGSFT